MKIKLRIAVLRSHYYQAGKWPWSKSGARGGMRFACRSHGCVSRAHPASVSVRHWRAPSSAGQRPRYCVDYLGREAR